MTFDESAIRTCTPTNKRKHKPPKVSSFARILELVLAVIAIVGKNIMNNNCATTGAGKPGEVIWKESGRKFWAILMTFWMNANEFCKRVSSKFEISSRKLKKTNEKNNAAE